MKKKTLTVSELIELLNSAPQDYQVFVSDDCCGCFGEANHFEVHDDCVEIGSEMHE